MLREGELELGNDQQCWIGTNKCEDDIQDLKWTLEDQVTQLFLALKPERTRAGGDFLNSQWCADSNGDFHPCDSYVVNVDEFDNFRRDKNALKYYLKFSVDESGAMYLVMIGCHLDAFRA